MFFTSLGWKIATHLKKIGAFSTKNGYFFLRNFDYCYSLILLSFFFFSNIFLNHFETLRRIERGMGVKNKGANVGAE